MIFLNWSYTEINTIQKFLIIFFGKIRKKNRMVHDYTELQVIAYSTDVVVVGRSCDPFGPIRRHLKQN